MYGTGGVGRWFLGFVLWFARWSVFLGWILGMKGRGVFIALIAAAINDSMAAHYYGTEEAARMHQNEANKK